MSNAVDISCSCTASKVFSTSEVSCSVLCILRQRFPYYPPYAERLSFASSSAGSIFGVSTCGDNTLRSRMRSHTLQTTLRRGLRCASRPVIPDARINIHLVQGISVPLCFCLVLHRCDQVWSQRCASCCTRFNIHLVQGIQSVPLCFCLVLVRAKV